jgi:hypothetical protein
MITGPLRSIPSPNAPNPERLRAFLEYVADVLWELAQEEQARQAQINTYPAHWIQA